MCGSMVDIQSVTAEIRQGISNPVFGIRFRDPAILGPGLIPS